jgi:hypothetical protein
MPISNFCEDFILYKRVICSESANWTKCGSIRAALTTSRTAERREAPVSSQIIDYSADSSLYVPKTDGMMPDYDDFVIRKNTNQVFRIKSGRNDRETPLISSDKYAIFSIEKAVLPILDEGGE